MFSGGFEVKPSSRVKVPEPNSTLPFDDPKRTTASGRTHDEYVNLCEKGIDDYSEIGISDDMQKNYEELRKVGLSVGVAGLTQESFDFWCYAIRGGDLFPDHDRFSMDDGKCSAWFVDNFRDDVVVYGNKIFHKKDWCDWSDLNVGPYKLDDDYDEIYLVLEAEDTRKKDEVPGIAWWNPNLVKGARNFAEPARLLALYPELRKEFVEKFKELTTYGTRFATQRDATEAIVNALRPLGRTYEPEKLNFYTPWRQLDGDSHVNDYVTPLLHAGAIVDMMQEYANKKNDELFANLDGDKWGVAEKNGSFYIYMKDKKPIEATEYFNNWIWLTPGETKETVKTALIGETDNAMIRSGERCKDIQSELDLEGLDGDYERLKNYLGLDEETKKKLRDHAAPTKKCDEQAGVKECFSKNPPKFFDPDKCDCELQSAAMHCFNLDSKRTYIFSPEKKECVKCEDINPAKPVTPDGETCVEKKVKTTQVKIQEEEEQPEEQPQGPKVGKTNPWLTK